MSKGSNRRPAQVPKDKVDENWDKIFGKCTCEKDPEITCIVHPKAKQKPKNS